MLLFWSVYLLITCALHLFWRCWQGCNVQKYWIQKGGGGITCTFHFLVALVLFTIHLIFCLTRNPSDVLHKNVDMCIVSEYNITDGKILWMDFHCMNIFNKKWEGSTVMCIIYLCIIWPGTKYIECMCGDGRCFGLTCVKSDCCV